MESLAPAPSRFRTGRRLLLATAFAVAGLALVVVVRVTGLPLVFLLAMALFPALIPVQPLLAK